MSNVAPKGDCAHCVGLCCMALAFDRSVSFAFEKAAGDACRHLGPDDRCQIHRSRLAKGMSGCVAYDCLGAGQAVTAMFAGRHWASDDDLRVRMVEAFLLLRRIMEARQMLDVLAGMALVADVHEEVVRVRAALDGIDDQDETAVLSNAEAGGLAEAMALIRTLRGKDRQIFVKDARSHSLISFAR